MTQPDILVLGAGIVGVSAALHLQARGRDVVLVDRRAPGEGTSFGNAGLIERSSMVPYAFPRRWRTVLRYGLNRSTDLRFDWRHLPAAAPFLLRYWHHSAPRRLALAAEAMRPLVEASVAEHDALIAEAGAADLVRAEGWIALWRSPEGFRDGVTNSGTTPYRGLGADVLDAAAFAACEPDFAPGAVAGAIHWRDPKTVSDPSELTKRYARLFERRGGRVVQGDASTLDTSGSRWAVETADGPLRAGAAVVALGPQSGILARRFGSPVPLGIKRGYHRHYTPPPGRTLRHAVVDEDFGYVLAPMRRGVRLTTGVEFAHPDAPADPTQIVRAERRAHEIFDLGTPVETTPWLGLRPCLPDMRPVIGPAPGHPGLWFDFGHAHHGLTVGPASGRLLAEMMTGETPFADPAPFAATRFLRHP
ncbi:NAD(P)/FAD-dependent oxidoreductase [Aureimonas pseudogalii]|uniref:D-amino-acid dehydrogenase n=1 Tax=Aureimonas pseudogalii TaxID=1744844 RepID=A0A7W6E7R6_9HYPH|nr:FAD-binding oxidoreductase [Aureimonas pseudogalii]MBB3996306.1 D-amino-acid dehydrogenase [Aureimonas pseudogalii]